MTKKENPPQFLEGLRFQPDREGLEAILGPLEAQVMEALWKRDGEATVRELWGDLGQRTEIAYTTVLTIMQRLHEKGVVKRQDQGRAHRYQAVASRSSFDQGFLVRILQGVARQLRGTAAVGVLDRMNRRDRETLRKLLGEGEKG